MFIRVFRHYWQLPLALLAVFEAALAYASVFVAAMIRFEGSLVEIEQTYGPLWPRALLFAAIIFTAQAAMGLYSSRQRARLFGLVTRLTAATLGGVLVVAVVFYAVPQLFLGRGVLFLAAITAFSASLISRVVLERMVDDDIFKRRIMVYGSGARAKAIAGLRRRSDRRGFVICGYIPAEGDSPDGVDKSLTLASEPSLLELCQRLAVDEVVVAMDERRGQFPMHDLLECRLDGIEVTELVSFFERETGKLRLDMMNPSWMIFSDGFRQGRLHNVMERAFDIIASVMLLVMTSPIMLLTAIAIKIEDGWRASMFYGQVRVGQRDQPFKLLKFRSMRTDAESGGAVWAVKNDPRVTRVGGFIRKTRIDELPQILCVLRGQMSFVGPRPERPEFVSLLNERIPYYRERHTIKPGITGWAQLCYPYGSSEQDAVEKLQYDLFYVKNHSLLFYLAVLVQTVEVIVWGKGAR